MPFPIDQKLVVAVASSALFDLGEPHAVFTSQGKEAYRKFQREHEDDPLPRGIAFPFVRRLLALNRPDSDDTPVEVVFISRNDPDTGARLFNSASFNDLDITRGAFLGGEDPWPYIEAFNACLFLSGDPRNVEEAIANRAPAGLVLKSESVDDAGDPELRVALDFDGVIADDESEKVFTESGMEAFRAFERKMEDVAHNPGPLMRLLKELGKLQAVEDRRHEHDPGYTPRLKVAVVTARNAPVHRRFVTSLREWGVRVDQALLLGGIEKARVLGALRPHLFFDDQMTHLGPAAKFVPSVHVPFGKLNRANVEASNPASGGAPKAVVLTERRAE